MTPQKVWPIDVARHRRRWIAVSPLNTFQWEIRYPDDTPQSVYILAHAVRRQPDHSPCLTLTVTEPDGVSGVYAVRHQPDTRVPYVAFKRPPNDAIRQGNRFMWPYASTTQHDNWIGVSPLNTVNWWLRQRAADGEPETLHQVRVLANEVIAQDGEPGVLVCAVATPDSQVHTQPCGSADDPQAVLYCTP